MDAADIEHRFRYHPPKDDHARWAHGQVRDVCLAVAKALNDLCPDGREKSLAITHLEEAMYWANGAIARNQQGEEQ